MKRGIVWIIILVMLAIFWAVVLYPFVVHAQSAPTPVNGSVSDDAYGSDWNGDTENAPSKNAVFDKIETISAGGGSVTINTTSPMTGAGTGSTFTLGVDQSKMTLSSIGGAVTDAQVPNTITVDLATAASALAANPNDCGANQFATTIAANGNLTCAQPAFSDLSGSATDAQIPNDITVNLAATATALATNPSPCGVGDFVNDIAADGTLTCGTPAGGGGVGIGTVNPGTTNAIAKYVASTTLDDSSTMFDVSGNIGLGTNIPGGALVVMNGNVGIGTWKPTAAVLDIRGAGTNLFRSVNTTTQSSSGGGGLIAGQNDGTAMTNGNRAGFVVFQGSANTTGSVVNGAGISSYARGTLSTSSAPMDLRFQTSPSGSTTRLDRFVVDDNGNVGIGTINPIGGTSVMNGNFGVGTWAPTSRVQVVGTLDATTVTGANVTSGANPGHTHTTTSISGLDISDDTNLAGTTDEIILTGDTLSLDSKRKGWTDGGTNVYTSTTTDTVGIGTTTPRSGFEFDLRGDQYVSGNVGIGTTTVPDTPLYVEGIIKASEIRGTSASGTPFTITGANIGIGTSAAGASVVVGNSPSHTSVGLCIGTGGCIGYCTGALGTCSACTCLTIQ